MKQIKSTNTNWVLDYQDLIKKIIYINRIGCKEDKEDLIQEANLYLLEKAKYYNPELGFKYTTYILKGLTSFLRAKARKMNDATHKSQGFYEYYGAVRKFYFDYMDSHSGKKPQYGDYKVRFPSISKRLIDTILEVGENESFNSSLTTIEDVRHKEGDSLDIFGLEEIDSLDNNIDSKNRLKKLIISTKMLQPSSRRRVLKFLEYAYNNDDWSFRNYMHGVIDNKYYAEHQAIRMGLKKLLKRIQKIENKFNNRKILNSTIKQCYNKAIGDCYYE